MLVLRTGLLYLSYLITVILAVTDYADPQFQDANLKVLWAECVKRCVRMDPDRIYSFRQRDDTSFTSHTRLVVGHIWKDDINNDAELWTFQAYWFDMVFEGDRWTDAIYGGKCKTRQRPWQCQEGAVYKFKGTVDILRFDTVSDVVGDEAQALIDANNCYSLVTNNCKQFASKLAKRLQALPPQAAPPAPPPAPFDMTVNFPG
ncbi:MAG: hypothetical protein Q9213_005903 [Squamulea squamosa]